MPLSHTLRKGKAIKIGKAIVVLNDSNHDDNARLVIFEGETVEFLDEAPQKEKDQ